VDGDARVTPRPSKADRNQARLNERLRAEWIAGADDQ
jgi:hypothetical protein